MRVQATPRQFALFATLVVVDAIAKMVAYHSLPQNAPIDENCSLCLVLRLNNLGLGSAARLIAHSQGFTSLVAAGVFSASLAVALLMAATLRPLTGRAVAFFLVVAISATTAASYLLPPIGYGLVWVAFTRTAAVFLWVVIWLLSTSAVWRFGALLWAAAGLSNLLSFVYPPFRVVDYLWSAPLNRLTYIGVFNFADTLVLAGFLVFAAAAVMSAVRFLRGKTLTQLLRIGNRILGVAVLVFGLSAIATEQRSTAGRAIGGVLGGLLIAAGIVGIRGRIRRLPSAEQTGLIFIVLLLLSAIPAWGFREVWRAHTLHAFCHQTRVGMPLSELFGLERQHGIDDSYLAQAKYRGYVDQVHSNELDFRSHMFDPDFQCSIEHDGRVVTSVRLLQ
ncbi:MAG: hypothetical protein JSS29_19465 [Proteobacteria bacterium]|nr:hypothetical protein [Pseudomonadota bacterium]